jgi:hypothetical protein
MLLPVLSPADCKRVDDFFPNTWAALPFVQNAAAQELSDVQQKVIGMLELI